VKAADFDYAVKRHVRNSAIVREIDQARQRQLWRAAIIGGVLVSVLLFSAWQQFELVRNGYEMERLQQEHAEEQEVNRHLRLEIQTLKSPRRIEEIATKKLHLIAPGRDQAIIIERVTAPPPPVNSIVAAR
jgi:cell division protein FtsL